MRPPDAFRCPATTRMGIADIHLRCGRKQGHDGMHMLTVDLGDGRGLGRVEWDEPGRFVLTRKEVT